jgi:hypothetical protein
MDPTQVQQQAQHFMAVMFPMILLFGIIIVAITVWLFWRIFAKTGMGGALSLLILIPGIGGLIAICVLAFGNWKVVPAPQLYNVPPQYPPPPSFPPAA